MKTAEKASHTPGPWTQYAPAILNDERTKEVVDENYRFIEAGCGSTLDGTGGFHLTGFIRAVDAALIAAAPDMLEALEKCVAHMIQEYNFAGGDEEAKVNPNLARLSQIIESTEAVIRKAKGTM